MSDENKTGMLRRSLQVTPREMLTATPMRTVAPISIRRC